MPVSGKFKLYFGICFCWWCRSTQW